MPLTETAIRKAKPAANKPTRLFDGGGLYLQGHRMKPDSDSEVIALPFLMTYSARKLADEITFDL